MSRSQTCRDCVHFDDDPRSIEEQLPHIAILGSAYSSVRSVAGVCRESGRFHDPIPAQDCPSFTVRRRSS